MSRILFLSLGACASFWLAACQPADPVKADAEACSRLLAGDAEIEEDLAEYNSSVEGYCDCYAGTLATRPEETQAQVRKVVSAIIDIRESGNLSLEEAAERLEDVAEGREADESLDITEADFEAAGRVIEGVRRDLRDNDGQCPVAES